ncbi:MAG: hypothetical protein ABR576_01725 [Thermoanaerobaculia bacterium]
MILAQWVLPFLLFPVSAGAGPQPGSAPVVAFRPLTVSSDLRLEPESDRRLRRLVMGLDANDTRYYMLPETGTLPRSENDPRVRHLRRQLYWMNFELHHGRILTSVPQQTRFFVAVPEPGSVPGSHENEEEVFRDYLARRVGWSATQIREKVQFFRIPGTIPYPQDMAEPLGHDSRGRLVLGFGSETNAFYYEPLRRLVAAFPDEFVLREVPGVDTEGGDIELAWLPNGRIAVLVGRHRVLVALEARHGRPFRGVRIRDDEIRRAASEFSRAFFGLETLVVGEPALRDPGLASDVLIHSDMVVNVLRGSKGVTAFVPTYGVAAVDAITRLALEPEVRRRAEAEYDAVARQFRARGYRVVRIPFSDHPVRTPVQVGKFIDPTTGQQSLLLGKYPYHFALPDGRNLQWEIQSAFDALEKRVGAWRRSPTDARWSEVEKNLQAIWKEFDAAIHAPNPEFAAQVRIYEENGVRVFPVPVFPAGEGGIHCMLLK